MNWEINRLYTLLLKNSNLMEKDCWKANLNILSLHKKQKQYFFVQTEQKY